MVFQSLVGGGMLLWGRGNARRYGAKDSGFESRLMKQNQSVCRMQLGHALKNVMGADINNIFDPECQQQLLFEALSKQAEQKVVQQEAEQAHQQSVREVLAAMEALLDNFAALPFFFFVFEPFEALCAQ